MMMTRSLNLSPRRALVALAVLAHLGLSAAPAFAQVPVPTTPPPAGPALPLTMAEAESMGLEFNLQLKSDRLSPAVAAENLAGALAAYKPNLNASFSRNSSQSSAGSAIEGGSTITASSISGGTSVSQLMPWYGGQASANWNASRSETTRAFPFQNPNLSASMTLQYVQPLWQGLRIDGARAAVEQQRRNRTIADQQLDERIALTRFRIQNAYLSLVAAIAQRSVAQQNLDLTNRQLRDNRSRVEVGTMAPITIIEAEAEVARSEESVIVAEASISSAEDALRALILDPARPDYWTIRLEPTDTPTLQERPVDIDAAVREALANRTDLASQRLQLENTDLGIRLTQDETRPVVDLSARYSASGAGGTIFEYDQTPERNVVGQTSRGIAPVFGDVFRNNLPTWSLSLNVAYPLGKSSTEAALVRQRLQRQQQEIALKDRELQITTAVRASARDLQTNFKRVQVTQVARQRAQLQLEAEEKRFQVGLSDTFQLQQRQRDLANARTSELNATILYNRSLIEFEAIQRTPVR
jgi:outer membrane protein TolC